MTKKKKEEKNVQTAYYCKVCRSYYMHFDGHAIQDHLYGHLYFIESLLEQLDPLYEVDQNTTEELQKI